VVPPVPAAGVRWGPAGSGGPAWSTVGGTR